MPVPLNYLDAIFPYGGGTDNPGDNTAIAGGPTDQQATETGTLLPPPVPTGQYGPSAGNHNSTGGIFPAIVASLPQQGTDTVLPQTMQAVPVDGSLLESSKEYGGLDEADWEGVDPVYGTPRESGQDETVGETETTSGTSPTSFPEPTP
jgi:hypothetical protein